MKPWFTFLPLFHYLDFGMEHYWYSVRFEKDTRYYVMRLEQDLFDDWTIHAINGRIKSKLGQSRIIAFSSFEDAFDTFCEMAGTRHRHQYILRFMFTKATTLPGLIPFVLDRIQTGNTPKIAKKNQISARTAKSHEKIRNDLLSETVHEQICFAF